MTIETKFREGETVYLINNNKVDSSYVHSIHIDIYDDKVLEMYTLDSRNGVFDVSQLFSSKEELIKSL